MFRLLFRIFSRSENHFHRFIFRCRSIMNGQFERLCGPSRIVHYYIVRRCLFSCRYAIWTYLQIIYYWARVLGSLFREIIKTCRKMYFRCHSIFSSSVDKYFATNNQYVESYNEKMKFQIFTFHWSYICWCFLFKNIWCIHCSSNYLASWWIWIFC